MKPFEVDPEKCTHDGLCVEECPAQIIRLDAKEEIPMPADDFASYCIACGHCVAVCPTGSIAMIRRSSNEPRRKPERIVGLGV